MKDFPVGNIDIPGAKISDNRPMILWKNQGKPHNVFSTTWFSIMLENTLDDLKRLKICVTGPSGSKLTVSCSMEGMRVDCAFRPTEVGRHVLSAVLDEINVPGGPTSIIVQKSYENFHPSLVFDVEEIVDDIWCANGKFMMRKPWGICTIPGYQQILVTDRDSHEILVCNFEGRLLYKIGSWDNLNKPTGICYDATNHRLLIVDKDNHRVVVYSAEGHFIGFFGRKGRRSGEFYYPWDVATSPDGSRIVVSDSRNHRVQVFNKFCEFVGEYKGSSPRNFKRHLNYPRGVAFSNDGSVFYVTDFNLNRILRVSTDLSSGYVLRDGLYRPSGIHVDSADNVIVCDSRHHSVKILDAEFGCLEAEIKSIASLTLDLPLNVTDVGRNQVAILDLNGRIITF